MRVLADRDRALGDLEVGSSDVGVSEDVLEFVDDLVKCPESWLEFPIVDSMRIKAKEISNREATQSHVPDSQSSTLSATDKSVSIQQEHGDAWQDTTMVKTQSQQSIDRWSEVSGGADGATMLHPDGISFGNKGNALVMEKYMDSLFPKEQGHLPPYLRRKHISTDEENVRYRKGSKLKVSSDEESSDWQAVEDSDFEVLEK
ncbi:hypothetical protein ZIOFF_044752 [Zingiber officinale]|uniref:Uncharacterized protein n=1 Tax=Zingiber officinale TaxID=94328 RepID=A0A8J5GCA7_ZINOF|nr:hypothetical protein ZIOFF_044752 [Zingiber officinale]